MQLCFINFYQFLNKTKSNHRNTFCVRKYCRNTAVPEHVYFYSGNSFMTNEYAAFGKKKRYL